jgi:hypothetical protein
MINITSYDVVPPKVFRRVMRYALFNRGKLAVIITSPQDCLIDKIFQKLQSTMDYWHLNEINVLGFNISGDLLTFKFILTGTFVEKKLIINFKEDDYDQILSHEYIM